MPTESHPAYAEWELGGDAAICYVCREIRDNSEVLHGCNPGCLIKQYVPLR